MINTCQLLVTSTFERYEITSISTLSYYRLIQSSSTLYDNLFIHHCLYQSDLNDNTDKKTRYIQFQLELCDVEAPDKGRWSINRYRHILSRGVYMWNAYSFTKHHFESNVSINTQH